MHKYQVLIVEDEDFLILALKDNLEAEGYAVVVARNGDEAIACVRAHRPDLILLDLLMPTKSGFTVLLELKKNLEWKLIPVIVLSNFGGDTQRDQALKMGADDYFMKSQHTITEVIEKAKEYLEGKN